MSSTLTVCALINRCYTDGGIPHMNTHPGPSITLPSPSHHLLPLQVVLNEFIPFITDFCNCTGLESLCGGEVLPKKCPNWQLVSTGGGEHDSTKMKGIGINRWGYA
jgi:hypothetical protein